MVRTRLNERETLGKGRPRGEVLKCFKRQGNRVETA